MSAVVAPHLSICSLFDALFLFFFKCARYCAAFLYSFVIVLLTVVVGITVLRNIVKPFFPHPHTVIQRKLILLLMSTAASPAPVSVLGLFTLLDTGSNYSYSSREIVPALSVVTINV